MLENELEELEYMETFDPDVLIAKSLHNQQKIKTNDEIYYNEKHDQLCKEHYYYNVSTENPNPSNLFNEFHQLITRTHQYKLPYYISKDQYLYPWVDLHPNGKIKSIYSGRYEDPRAFIDADFQTIKKRFKRYRELVTIQRLSDERLIDHLQEISYQHKFNAEHVVPQSWFRAGEPMKGDLHHLFSCDPVCNTLRSNFPYYEYGAQESLSHHRSDCGKQDMNRFEPAYGKGIVARAMLYFLLRYPKKITKKFQKYINIPMLVRWHKQYKVTEYEKHRNKAIFEVQGNRNPFIDFLDVLTKISIPTRS